MVWLSEAEARNAGIAEKDRIEVFGANGVLTARTAVSQCVKAGPESLMRPKVWYVPPLSPIENAVEAGRVAAQDGRPDP